MADTHKPARERVRHEVCAASDLPPGERLIVEVADRSIGVFNVDGDYLALANSHGVVAVSRTRRRRTCSGC